MSTFIEDIQQSSDDCAESETGTVVTNGTQIVIDGRGAWGGFRFQGVNIPQGAKIIDAIFYARYTGDSTAEAITVELYGVDTDDFSTTWSSTVKPSGQTLTTAYDSNTFNGAFTPNGLYATYQYDATAIVQEIVDRAGWSSGNDMGFVLKRLFDVGRGTDVKFNAYDGTPANACDLQITFLSMQLNISDSWKQVQGMQINIGDVWKTISGVQVNIGDTWETVF